MPLSIMINIMIPQLRDFLQMGRYSYDDMPPEGYRERRESGKRGTFVIAFVGILLTLIAIIVYLMYTPRSAVPAAVSEPEDAVVAEAESVPVPESGTLPSAEPEAEVVVPETYDEPVISAVKPLSVISYTVSEGDTLISISGKFGVSASTIKEFNSIDDVKLVPGQNIEIPEYSGMLYTVKDGDTLESIAESYNPGLSANDLAALNGLDTRSIEAGSQLFIPEVGSDLARDERFSSPVPGGRVIKHRGEFYRDRAETVDGVVIAAAPGTAVVSASDGVVKSVGMTDDRRRYVEIAGTDGYSALYMDMENPRVRAGQELEQGSIIGMIGSSSKYYGEPAILFSIMQDGISIDPEDMIAF